MKNELENQMQEFFKFLRLDISPQKVIVKSGSDKILSSYSWNQLEMKACYRNSALLTLSPLSIEGNEKVEYCFGYALKHIPMEHAWLCIDGVYYDATWEKFTDIGEHYFLLKKFNKEELFKFMEKTDFVAPDLQSLVELDFIKKLKKEEVFQKA
jgi:hypothetical protein